MSEGEIEIALFLHVSPDELIGELEKQMRQTGAPYLNVRSDDDKWGVVCFTERYDHMAMWANYADQGRGVAIE